MWGGEEKATLRRRERQVQDAEERADNLLQSAAAEVDRQSQALEEERRILQQHRHAFEQVNTCSLVFVHAHMHFPDHVLSTTYLSNTTGDPACKAVAWWCARLCRQHVVQCCTAFSKAMQPD